ncbi:hypothetical protein IMY05_C4702000500 [Salix suchowensis]|nr:hypothetical protein IMY05_C4702000500 [Salix suchowensis]
MSLPTAPKDISDHPVSGSVTDPVNKADKDADVDRKIRLFGVITALRAGRVPSNAQVDQTLKYVLDNSPVDVSTLSHDGRKLISDTRDIIETARLMVQEKNTDELFQNFLWHTRDVKVDGAKKDPNEVLPVDKEKARQDGQKDEERLARVDESAPNDQFITEGGRVAGPNETPVLEARIPGTDATVAQHPKESLGSGAKVKSTDGTVKSGDQAMREAGAQAGQLKTEGKAKAAAERDDVTARANGIQEGGETAEAKKQTLMDKMRGYRDGLTDKIPQEHKDRASDQYDRTRHFLTEEYFPEERRDQFIFRGKKVIIECQKHEDYQESIRWLLNYLEEYVGHVRTVGEHGKTSGAQITSDPALKQSVSELLTLLERFANGKTTADIVDSINALIDDTRRDPDLRAWFKNIDTYMRKYKGHFDNLFGTVGDWFKAMGDDPLNKSEGSLKFKPQLWNDIRKVIVPTLVDKVGYVPIPRIEYTDENLDLVVENLTLSGRNLFPNVVSFEAHNFVKFSPYNAIRDESHHEFTASFPRVKLTLGQIQADMRDVAFYFRKKSGIPKLMDSGLADVVLGGNGLTLYILIEPKAVADAITTGMEYVDGQLVAVRDRMQEAKQTDGESRTQVLQDVITFRCLLSLTSSPQFRQLFKRKQEEASVKSHEKSSQFKVVSNKRDSVSLIPVTPPVGSTELLSVKRKPSRVQNGGAKRTFCITLA